MPILSEESIEVCSIYQFFTVLACWYNCASVDSSRHLNVSFSFPQSIKEVQPVRLVFLLRFIFPFLHCALNSRHSESVNTIGSFGFI